MLSKKLVTEAIVEGGTARLRPVILTLSQQYWD